MRDSDGGLELCGNSGSIQECSDSGSFLVFIAIQYFGLHQTPWWPSGKESSANSGDTGLTPGLGRSHGKGNDNSL